MKFIRVLKATKPQRAWSGKLDKIDNLLQWMYNKDILSPREKQIKDSLFHDYYRYYNDGDFPARLRKYGLGKYSNEKEIEEILEREVENFIKKILSKYAGKYDRSEFHYDTLISSIKHVLDISRFEDKDSYFDSSSLDYFIREIPGLDDEIRDCAKQVKIIGKKLMQDIDSEVELHKNDLPEAADLHNTALGYSIPKMKELGLWTSQLDEQYKEMAKLIIQIRTKLKNVMIAAEEARSLKLL